jgi:hypothetical protein
MKKFFNWMLAAIITCGASVFTSCTNGNGDNPVVPVEPDLNVAEKIIGKWMVAEMDGLPVPTNQKVVQTFLSATKVTESLSRTNYSDDTDKWHTSLEGTCSIEGSTVTMTFLPEDGVTTTCILNVQSITSTEMVASTKRTTIDNGRTVYEQEAKLRMVKVGADQSQAILGMWEGRMTSEQSEYGDVEDHRWEFLLDGTFNFFRKVDGQWQISDDDYADYFVDGNLLCTRWKNAGAGNEEHREWWEIESIENGVMKWTALRQKEDGTTYTATFEMKKAGVPSTQEELEQKLVGKWLYWGYDGQIAETGESSVTTFVMEGSTLKAYITQSLQKYDLWVHNQPAEVKIDGNKVTVTMQSGNTTTVEEMTDITIDEDELAYTSKFTVYKDGEMVDDMVYQLHCTKCTDDYSQAILGRWEGTITSDEPGFEPEPFCEEYFSDGTNVEYQLIDGQWVEMETEYAEYFIDGNLLLTRWKYPGKEEERENCIIVSYTDGILIINEAVESNDRIYIYKNILKKIVQ